MRLAKREHALANKSAHAFMHGIGYVFIGPQQPRNAITHGCRPPNSATPGSLHWIDAPHGKRLQLRWNGVWEHPHNPAAGNRLGWTPEYLASWGWQYRLAC